MPLNISIILSSVREKSQGIKAAKYLSEKCSERKFNVTIIDPKEYNLPLLDKMFKEYPKGTAPEGLEKLHEILTSSDGYIIVTGEYNHSLPPALTNLMDHFREEYFFKPAAITSYSGGPIMGMRSAVQARVFLGELGMVTPRMILGIPGIHKAFDSEGKPADDVINSKVKKFLDEFEWYANALKEARSKSMPG
ncbi:MAG: NADPH-dependent FMN reductase [Ignavibacteriae bacterium HGW-Ignavibacteriae-3]|nr:MAG: NADPH-dependent FMN reductase [Ignavibacteriae bacterium HGW-Ignavibacteriae-3]